MYPRLNLHVSEEILGYFVEIALHPCCIVMQMRKTIREKSYLWHNSWPAIMSGQFPITIIIFFRDWRKWRKFHCFCCNWGVFWLPCFIFFISYYLFLLFIIIMGDFNFVSSSYTSTTIQQATISLHCALETSLNNTKWIWFHVDSFACIHLTLERNGLRRFVQHRIKSGRPKRTEIIKFQETTIRFYY